MPPTLALLIGVVFILFAFRVYPKQGFTASGALFWPTLWYLVVATRPVGFWLDLWGIPLPGDSGDPTDGSSIERYFFLSLTLIGFWILSRRRFDWGMALRLNPWLTALLLFMAASIIWSQYPFVSFKRYIKVLGSIVMALVVLTEEHPLESMLTVLRRCLYIHLPMSLICTRYFRDIGVSFDYSGAHSSWNGIATTKNTLGQVAMLGILYFSWEIRRCWGQQGWRNVHFIYLAIAAFLLKGAADSVSMTSVSMAAFALIVFHRIQALRLQPSAVRPFVRLVFGATMALVTFFIIHSVVVFAEDSVFGKMITLLGRDITITDRIYIWGEVYAVAASSPIVGIGYGAFWIGRLVNIPWNANMSWVLGQAHSGYVDTYLQLGYVGMFLLAGVLFSTIPKLLKTMSENFDFACLRITLLLTIAFINVSESTFLRGDHHLWFMMLLVLWVLPPKPAPATDLGTPLPSPR